MNRHRTALACGLYLLVDFLVLTISCCGGWNFAFNHFFLLLGFYAAWSGMIVALFKGANMKMVLIPTIYLLSLTAELGAVWNYTVSVPQDLQVFTIVVVGYVAFWNSRFLFMGYWLEEGRGHGPGFSKFIAFCVLCTPLCIWLLCVGIRIVLHNVL